MQESDHSRQLTRAAELIAASRQPLLICHVAPDGDAIGSLLGLLWLLRAQGKDPIAACQDRVPDNLRFLPGSDVVVGQPVCQPDLVIAVDCSDLERLGSAFDNSLLRRTPLLNIDHHVTNTLFGVVNVVAPAATSTAEVIYDLAVSQAWTISFGAAQCLLTGLVTDTRGFRTSNVTARTLEIAQRLMEAGGSLHAVNEGVLEQRSFDTVCLWGHALAAARLEDGIAWTTIPLTMRAPCGDVEQSDSGLANFLVSADEVEVAVVLVERRDGPIDVGFRSAGRVDVAQLALKLGGGGHPRAAGCTLSLPMDEAVTLVLRAADDALAAAIEP